MELYVGLDVSLDLTAVCVLDGAGKVIWRGRCSSTPDAIAGVVREHAPTAVRIGLEAGQLSTWLVHGLRQLGLPAICLDARHAKAALSLQINKTDDNDALGLAHIVRTGWYREVAAGQSHMEFAVVEGWRRLLGEWRYQLRLRVPERRGTRVGAFLCSE